MKKIKRPNFSNESQKCSKNISIQSFNLFYRDIEDLMMSLNEKYVDFQQKQHYFEEKNRYDLEKLDSLRLVRHQLIQSIFYKWSNMMEKYESYDINNMIIKIKKSNSVIDHYNQMIQNLKKKDDIQLQVLYEEHIDLRKKCVIAVQSVKYWIPDWNKFYRTELITSKNCTTSINTLYRNQFECISDCMFDPKSLHEMKPVTIKQNGDQTIKTGFILGIPVILIKKRIKTNDHKRDNELYMKMYDIVYNQKTEQKKSVRHLWMILNSYNTKTNQLNEAKNGIVLNHVSEFCHNYCKTYFCSIDFQIDKNSKMLIPHVVQLKENIGTMSIYNLNRYIRYQLEPETDKQNIKAILTNKMNVLSSLFIQLVFAIFCGQVSVSFVHQNLSSKKIKLVSVDFDTALYYEYNSVVYKIPTFGNLVFVQDFSCSTVKTQSHYSQPMNIVLHHRSFFDIVDFQYLDMMCFLRHYYIEEDANFLQNLLDYGIDDKLEPFKMISNYFLSCNYPLNSQEFSVIHPVQYEQQKIFVDPYKIEEYQISDIETRHPFLEEDEKQTIKTSTTINDKDKNALYENMKHFGSSPSVSRPLKNEFISWHPITLKTLCSENASMENWFDTKIARSLIVEFESLSSSQKKKINHIKSFDHYR